MEVLDFVNQPPCNPVCIRMLVSDSLLFTSWKCHQTFCSSKVLSWCFFVVIVEDVNLAQECHGAEVLLGEFGETLFNGEYSCYDLERGFTRHLIEEEDKPGIVIGLHKPSIINTIRLLLWDKDPRSYSYKVECSLDNQNWTQIVDYSSYFCRSWQRIHFTPKVIRYPFLFNFIGPYSARGLLVLPSIIFPFKHLSLCY